jgi:hypothetical protein
LVEAHDVLVNGKGERLDQVLSVNGLTDARYLTEVSGIMSVTGTVQAGNDSNDIGTQRSMFFYFTAIVPITCSVITNYDKFMEVMGDANMLNPGVCISTHGTGEQMIDGDAPVVPLYMYYDSTHSAKWRLRFVDPADMYPSGATGIPAGILEMEIDTVHLFTCLCKPLNYDINMQG